jgi:hypothetical protein
VPDENKFTRLREVGYRVPVTCGLCVHGNFTGRGRDGGQGTWGTCDLHRYEHKKHDNPEGGRGVSVIAAGTCPSAEADPARTVILGAHIEFLDDGSTGA